jgi:hypothetical protein
MTTNASNQPNHSPQQNGYNPITLEDVTKPPQSPWPEYFGELRDPVARCIAAPLLLFIFLFSRGEPLVAPLTLLVLLGCLFVRLDNHPRQIAAVPLTLAAIKLSFQMASLLSSSEQSALSLRNSSMDPGFIWLPMFSRFALSSSLGEIPSPLKLFSPALACSSRRDFSLDRDLLPFFICLTPCSSWRWSSESSWI